MEAIWFSGVQSMEQGKVNMNENSSVAENSGIAKSKECTLPEKEDVCATETALEASASDVCAAEVSDSDTENACAEKTSESDATEVRTVEAESSAIEAEEACTVQTEASVNETEEACTVQTEASVNETEEACTVQTEASVSETEEACTVQTESSVSETEEVCTVQTESDADNMKDAHRAEAGKKKHAVLMEILDWAKYIAIALVVVFIIRTFLFTMICVEGNSMLETLENGDRIAVTIIDLNIHGPQRGKIVLCKLPGVPKNCIKRIIGMPGDKIEIVDGITYLNDEEIEEEYVVYLNTGEYSGPVFLGEDEYFVMGDNRIVSYDSREAGPISRSQIIGNASFCLWPFESFGSIEMEWME